MKNSIKNLQLQLKSVAMLSAKQQVAVKGGVIIIEDGNIM